MSLKPASAAVAAAATAATASAKRKSSRSGGSKSAQAPKQRAMRLVNGHPESAVLDMRLTDILAPNLRVLVVGINPGVFSAASGHHYGNSANHFWPCLSASGLVPRPVTYHDDADCLQWGIGFTNMVPRCSRSEADLTKAELSEGAAALQEKIVQLQPGVVCFNGKGIYEIFSGQKCKEFGRQPLTLPGCKSIIFVMPSTSPRTSKWPRWTDKLPFFLELYRLCNEANGAATAT